MNEPLWIRLRRLFVRVRTEGYGPRREIAAIASGVFIGCLPLYGFHLLICITVGAVFRLNRLKMYLAANISNPFVAPWLVLLEIQTGAWLRRGSLHPLTLQEARTTSLAIVGSDLAVGSVAVGVVLAGLAGWVTSVLVRRTEEQRAFVNLACGAADRYVTSGVMTWEFARGKLRRDPIYKALVCGGLLNRPSTSAANLSDPRSHPRPYGTLLDVGCGIGLSLALLAEASRARRAGAWLATWPVPPCFERLVGIEVRSRAATRATTALAGDAEVIVGDACHVAQGRLRTVLVFDVLHLMRPEEQETLLASLASALEPDGLLLIREADAAAGWRFTAVHWGNRLKAWAGGSWRQEFHFRTAAEWRACLAGHGLRVEIRDMSQGTPFANVLLVTSRQSPGE